ncbi:hypothetical protein [Sphingomonas sp. MMS24-J13]|uniref:hypothetical protein n=1 Tax=Sphingomonas sp. MMS24-J13 TaxID=3238686 RepID=UPI00384DBCAD
MFSVVGWLGLIAAGVPSPTAASREAPTAVTLMPPDQARQVVVGCGLPDQHVSVAYEQDMQEDVIWIARDQSPLPEHTLACVARASLQTIYYVYFRDAAEQSRYGSIYSKIENEVEVREARKWLSERGRLSAIPLPEKDRLANYVKAVEIFCGVKEGALLVARDNEFITFTHGGLGRITSNGIEGAAATNEQYECVTRVMSAADLRSRGIFFGFIGNAAANAR